MEGERLKNTKKRSFKEIIKTIEEKYGVFYSSEFFSKYVLLFLGNNGVSLDEMRTMVQEHLLKDGKVTVPSEMKNGNIYHFPYNPKNKMVDYYDKTPCIVYLGKTMDGDGFYGLNLNYLPEILRHEVVSRLPHYRKEVLYEFFANTRGRTSKNKALNNTEVDINFGYKEAKIVYRREYRQMIKKYLYRRLEKNPVLFGLEIAKLVTMFELHEFNKKTPYPLWKKIVTSIAKEGKLNA